MVQRADKERLDQLGRGRFLTDEEIGTRIEEMFLNASSLVPYGQVLLLTVYLTLRKINV
jgi:hypothetical protein